MKTPAFFALVLLAACTPRTYAVWTPAHPLHATLTACADIDAWVSKSGKEGLMVTMFLRGLGEQACTVEVKGARFQTLGVMHEAARLPPSVELREGADVYLFVAFPFDDNTAWNEGAREGAVELDLADRKLSFSLVQTEREPSGPCEYVR